MTNYKSVGEVIEGHFPGSGGWLYGKINNKRVYSQVRDHLYIPRSFPIKNTISQEIKR